MNGFDLDELAAAFAVAVPTTVYIARGSWSEI